MYRLAFSSDQRNLLPGLNQERVQGIYPMKSKTGDLKLIIRQGQMLFGYKHTSEKWHRQWDEKVFNKVGQYPLNRYPWTVDDKILPNENVVMIKHSDGIRFYRLNDAKPGLDLLAEDGNFHEVYDFDFLFGKFYPNSEWLGVMTRNRNNEIKFYAATKDSFNVWSDDDDDPLYPLVTNLFFSPIWKARNIEFFTTDLRKRGVEAIGLRSSEGLEFYEFDNDYLLKRIAKTSQMSKSNEEDTIFFVNLTHQQYKDILHLNVSGLSTFQFDNSRNDYKLLHCNTAFSQYFGWLPKFTDSIQILDVDSDGRDDIIFTGPQGIKAISFDTSNRKWNEILTSENLTSLQRYSTVVGTLSMDQTSVFVQDEDGNVQWGKIIKAPVITSTTTTTTTTKAPVTTLKSFNDIPGQIPRQILSEKPILRWADQWRDNYLKEAVDMGSGQVQFSLPMIDTSSTGWGLQLSLSYHNQAVYSDLLGVGWSFSLSEDYIFVDNRGSIYPKDANYYLMMQGRPQKLKLIESSGGVDSYEITEFSDDKDEISIKYYSSQQRWIIEGEAEQTVYGKAIDSDSKDALQWSLSWQNWRGVGRDILQLQSIIIAWYLNKRINKMNQRALYYHYDVDQKHISGAAYTSAIRLKTIRDNENLQFIIDYAAKNAIEYKKCDPIDDQGNISFPVQLEKSHHIKRYSIVTAAYRQTLKFVYSFDGDNRLLTAINQELPQNDESVLKFSYKNVLENPVIESCKLPRGVEVTFNYEVKTVPNAINGAVIYPTREKAKIGYGLDYAVMAYRDLHSTQGKIIMKLLNREMTLTTHDCRNDKENFQCPSAQSEIKDYALQTYQDSFVLFVEDENNRMLHFYNRRDDKWSKDKAHLSFGKEAIVRFNEHVIAVSEKNQNEIIIFSRNDDKSDWIKTKINLSRSLSRLAMHEHMIVGYDDYQLMLFHQNSQNFWQLRILETNLNYFKTSFDFFDLEQNMKHEYLTALNQSGLQIVNNFIMLSALKENNGQLSSSIHLFLLNDQYKIIKGYSFTVNREKILDVEYEFKDKNSVYYLGYVNENRVYRVRIKKAIGEVIKDVESIRNKNRRQDAIDERLKQLNKADGWKELFKKSLLINWSLYTTQISELGVICGNNTILRMTGTKWQRESLQNPDKILLGKNFILEPVNNEKSLYKLYKQDENKNKRGESLLEFSLYYPGQLLNRYPFYIAFHVFQDAVNVVTFKDEKTLGESRMFHNEQLLADSDYKNLVTIANATVLTMSHSEPQEYRVRSSSFLISRRKLFVNKMTFITDDEIRSTAYQRSYSRDEYAKTFSETVKMFPGAKINQYGWYEATFSLHLVSGNITTSEKYFNANGKEVLAPIRQSQENQDEATSEKSNEQSKIFDKSGKWMISDFSPYNLNDDIGAYYGFETYEKNSIGNSKFWIIHNSQIVKGGFAFTGENYLQLKPSSFIEGEFYPLHQQNVYLAACWIRSSQPMPLDSAVPYLKAILSTSNGVEFIRLQAQVKQQSDDWFYLELPIDFQLIKQIYREYKEHMNDNTLPSVEKTTFKIKLRVESFYQQIIDLDHIRFTPLTNDFQATIYNPLTGSHTAIIQTNGLVLRTIYNRLQQKIANLNEDGQIESLTSSSYTDRGNKTKFIPNILTFEPENGFYETFNTFSMLNRWKVDDADAWNISHGQLWHKHSNKHRVKANEDLFDNNAAALRFYFALQDSHASLSLNFNGIGSFYFTRQSDDSIELILLNKSFVNQLPSSGEVIIMIENSFVWLWFDGVQLVDSTFSSNSNLPWSSFAFEAQGQVLIEDCFIMNRLSVRVEYQNSFGEKIQEIHLEDSQNAQITETLYDELGREAINTKTVRVHRKGIDSLLDYRPNFVTNKNSLWQTGILQGEIDKFHTDDEGFAYTRTQYAPNPLNQAIALGLPGKDFSISGSFTTKMSQETDVAFLSILFPSDQGFRQQEQHTPNGSRTISIHDKNKNQIARYVQVAGYNHLLSTFEYDAENRLVKILPPLYHEKVESAMRLTPLQPGEDHLSSNEKQWQEKLATRYIYDNDGHMIRKITPDSGATEYLYNKLGQNRFMVTLNELNQVKQIVFYDYDLKGEIIRSGHLTQMLSIGILRELLEKPTLPYAKIYQQFINSDDNYDPLSRGRIKYLITQNPGFTLYENLRFDGQQQFLSKSAITMSGEAENDQLSEIKKEFVRDKVKSITYPVEVDGQPLQLIHTYNRLGKLIEITTPSQNYVSFTYHATGQLASDRYQSGVTRNYRYNSPGFLEQIKDQFLTEDVFYTDKGYGQKGFGDGMIMQTTFKANWVENSDRRYFQLNDDDLIGNFSKSCIDALKRNNYLNANGKPLKLFIHDVDNTLPLKCNKNDVAEKFAEKKPPNYYGYRYAYGNHQELIKAKYFTEDTENFIEPLQSDSFSKEIHGLNLQKSQKIWQLLVENKFILADRPRTDFMIGKAGKSFFQEDKLLVDLTSLHPNYIQYVVPIVKLILSSIIERKSITQADFETIFLNWNDLDRNSYILLSNYQLRQARSIYKMLVNKGYLSKNDLPLDKQFKSILSEFSNFMPEIIRVLTQRFAYALGKTAFDVESYKIDANGNHHLFYTGFKHHELTYRHGTNQIESIKLGSPTIDQGDPPIYSVKHDHQGNIIQALYKGIQTIEYHPVSQRTTKIQLTDGRTLKFFYDAKGERVFKQVYNAKDEITHEIRYLRDEHGRVMVDQKTSYLSSRPQKIITAYIYGPRGLLGFYRNNAFYSVTTDHSGSVRLVIKSGQVVAAYDYLPYGQLMRSYGNDPQDHINYRYTGQEFDEETGLYNYHARLYDPTIGRFYQIDPKAQYFSPYKYAGNSPISVVDPDGEFAFLITCIVLAIVGAYLGGAAANNRWNPADWDFKDHGTWLGMFGGAVAGGLLPVGFGASVAFIGGLAGSTAIGITATVGLGIGGAYLSTAAASGSWNPAQWRWDQPGMYSAAFQGFGSGSSIAGGIGVAHSFANTGKALTSVTSALHISREAGKWIFLTVSYTAGVGAAYGMAVIANEGNAAFWEWDWTNPATWNSLIDGFDTGMGWPQNIMELGRGIKKVVKNPSKLGSQLEKSASKRAVAIAIIKNPKHPLFKVTTSMLMAYFMGSSANDDLDITRWNLASFSTYSGILNGVFFGKDISNMLKFSRESNIKPPSNELIPVHKNKNNYFSRKFDNFLDVIQIYRKKMEIQNVFEILFSSDTMRNTMMGHLKDEPASVRGTAEIFFKQGFESWKMGKSKPPREFAVFILKEIETSLKKSFGKLREWKSDAREHAKKQHEVYPDRDVEFLSCSKAKRRKRSPGSMPCSPKQTMIENADVTKPEIIKHFFDINDPGIKINGDEYQTVEIGNRNSPEGFSEHFSLLLEKTPIILGPTYPVFFTNVMLGSLATTHEMTNSIHAKVEKVEVPLFGHRGDSNRSGNVPKIQHDALNLFFKTEVDGKTKLICRTFIAQDHSLAHTKEAHAYYKKELTDAYKISDEKLNSMLKSLDLSPGKYDVEKTVYYINTDHSLDVKKITTTDYQFNGWFSKSDYTEMKASSVDYNAALEKIASNERVNVEAGTKELMENLVNAYNANREIKNFQSKDFYPTKRSESEFHAFVYGSLSLNFKYLHDLDIYVERIAGRGYADLMLLSRKGSDGGKNWKAIPIVVEFKADSTSSSGAGDQITGTGYLYNLSMRTVSEQALNVGVNSFVSIDKAVEIKSQNIPQYEGFANRIADNKNLHTLKDDLTTQLKHLYYSISPLAIKTTKNENQHYLSHLILGEFLSKSNLDVYVPKIQSDSVRTILFKSKDSSNNWMMLNMIESSKNIAINEVPVYVFKDIGPHENFIPNEINRDDVTVVDIKINSKSKVGWSPSEPKRTVSNVKDDINYFFQDLTIKTGNEAFITKIYGNMENVYGHVKSIDAENFFQKDHTKIELDKIESIKDIVNSESDVQAIIQGLFTSNPRTILMDDSVNVVKVFPEPNLSRDGRIDLLVSKLNIDGDRVTESALIVNEIKYTKDGMIDLENKYNEGTEQIVKYAYHLKSVTDLKSFKPVVIAFDKISGSSKVNSMDDAAVIHTSDSETESFYFGSPMEINSPTRQHSFPHADVDDIDMYFSYDRFIAEDSRKRPHEDLTDSDLSEDARMERRQLLIQKIDCLPFEIEKSNDTCEMFSTSASSRPTSWITSAWKRFINILPSFSSTPQLSTIYNTPHPSVSIAVEEYTTSHFHGLLQLIDLFVRKQTGQKYQQFTTTSEFDIAEQCLQATEHAAKYIETLKNNQNTEIPDEFECYQAFLRGTFVNNNLITQMAYPSSKCSISNIYPQLT